MKSTLKRTWAEIDLGALEYNYKKIREHIGENVKFLGVVKADAYGHGSVMVAGKLQQLGADYLAVSSIDEAMELLAPEIEVVHLKDFKVEDGKMVSIAAGTGMMKYDKILKFLKENKPSIEATLENTKPENAVQTREFIEKVYNEV